MKERQIGIRELKARLSQCVRDVKMGATIVVTERGQRVARIVRMADSLTERISTLRDAGAVQWSGRRLSRTKPIAQLRTPKTVAQILVENRD